MINIKVKEIKNIWQKDKRIEKIRKKLTPMVVKSLHCSDIKYDSQDLEHQVLFRMTTGANIKEAFSEQEYIVKERMKKAKIPPDKLFKFGTIREEHDWKMEWGIGKKTLYATNGKEKKIVDFREITDREEMCLYKTIIDDYHYIHCSRCNDGYMFGFFIRGEELPFAVEEIEPCRISRNYKKAVLMLSDINYHTTCELTRFYSVPNTPKNIIGILDKLVGKELKKKGYEWIMTTTMPTFAKTRATTIAGGIDQPLMAKKLKFEFFKREDGRYQFCVDRNKKGKEIIQSNWDIFPAIEMVKPLTKGLSPNIDKDKLYYIEK